MLDTAIKFLRSHQGRQIRLVMDKKEVKITKFGDIFVRCQTFVRHSTVVERCTVCPGPAVNLCSVTVDS